MKLQDEHFKCKRLKAMGTLGYIIFLNTCSSKYTLCQPKLQETPETFTSFLNAYMTPLNFSYLLADFMRTILGEPQTDSTVCESSEETAGSNSDKSSVK